DITQNGAAMVAGATTAAAGSGNVLLTRAGNDFGSVGATGTVVSIADQNALALGAITATTLNVSTSAGNGAVTQNAPVTIAGVATIDAGNGNVSLGLANGFGSIGLTGGTVAVNALAGLTLDTVNAASLNATASGAI